MSIAITPEHYELADSVRSLVARVAPSEVLHAALESPVENPPPYWQAAAEQGLQGVHLAESVGGQGFGILELAVVLAEFGYGAVPGPFVPSAIASALIAAHDPQAKVLAELATGAAIAAYALDSGLTATRHGDVLVIRGEVRAVPAAAQASVLVLPVAIESRDEWVVLRNDQLEIEAVKSLDPLRPIAHVRANAVDVSDDALLSNLTMTTAHALMSTLLSAEAVGVARWATDTASAYAKIREQFGRPIGQFQAIKHKCAEMIADTERATAAVWDAARALDDAGESSSDVEFAAAVAATLAPATAQRCTQDCIQVHGGIGFTWEHDTNVYRNTLTAERVSIGGSDSTFLPTLGEFVDFVRDYRFEGQFDQVARHRAGQLIAEGHATKLLNLRSTLLTLAGGDPMAPAAISKLLSMRTGQGYAEFAVSSFGTDAVIGDTERLPGKWGEYLLASRATTIYGGTSEVQLNIIAERLLGLPRDP